MADLLRRQWFLIVLLVFLVLAFTWPDQVYALVGSLPSRLLVAGSLFLTAWCLDSRSLARQLTRPLPALLAFGLSYVALPVLGWTASLLLADDLQIGLRIMVCVPCTLASAVVWTRRGGGNEATALAVVLLTTGLSWLITPPLLLLLTGRSVQLDAAAVMGDLVLCLIVPSALGQLCRLSRRLAEVARQHRGRLSVIAQLLVLMIILKAGSGAGLALRDPSAVVSPVTWGVAIAAVLVTHLAGLGLGLWSAGRCGFDGPEQTAVAIGCSQKTLPVALMLFEGFFREAYPLAVMALVFYHVGQLVVDTPIADALARRRNRPC